MFVEEATIPATHMMITHQPSLPYSTCAQVLETVQKSTFINPIRQRPMLLRDHRVIAFRGSGVLRSFFEFLGEMLVVEENPRVLSNIRNKKSGTGE